MDNFDYNEHMENEFVGMGIVDHNMMLHVYKRLQNHNELLHQTF
jgi:hypothetical protein